MATKDNLLTVKELMEVRGVDRSTIWRWRKDGLPYVNRGKRSPRFDMEKVEEWERARGEHGDTGGILDKA